jgi:RimJ/RimL family protein N-acetyltransferase
MNFTEDIVLENNIALLRPLTSEDEEGFSKIAFDADIWKFFPTRVSNHEELNEFIKTALEDRKRNFRYPFTIIQKTSKKIAGSTSFANVSLKDKRIEIGWTWLGKKFRGTGLNKECKFLLLQYAFEHLNFERVELKTDVLNKASRRAMEKIGAKEEGILRSHMLMHDGRRRDTIYYSILASEWSKIKMSFRT